MQDQTGHILRAAETAYRILSGFSRINYNYDMKYLISFVARYDGISKLKDNRWGFFPGVSIGWNVMEENFWEGFENFRGSIQSKTTIELWGKW